MSRGLSVVATVKQLKPNHTSEMIEKAHILGWMVEWLQGFFLVADDIMDESELRRGKPCWYKLPGVGKRAINDSLLLQSCMHMIIRECFQRDACYASVLDEILTVTFRTEIGQLLDLFSNDSDHTVNYDSFTCKRYHEIATFKTAHYSFVLPVKLGFILCGEEMPEGLVECLLEVGRFFQVQDDYLDAYGDPSVMGKVGTDIQEGKCSWMAVKLVELMTPEDFNVFKKEYGKSDVDSVSFIKSLYEKYNLASCFKQYEQEMQNAINNQANQLTHKGIVEMFTKKIFGRNK